MIFTRILAFFTGLMLLIPGWFPMEQAMRPMIEGREATDRGRAIQLADSYYAQYFRPNAHFLSMFPYSAQSASCWEAIGLLSLSIRMARLAPGIYGKKLDSALDTICHYRKIDSGGGFAGYVVPWTLFRFSAARHGIAYDDNMWLGRDFAALYAQTGEARYLMLAREVGDFLISEGYVDLPDAVFTQAGFAAPEKPVGGFYWDTRHDAVHTCSTGPAAQFFAALYNITGEDVYLDYAEKSFRFLPYLVNGDGVFHDLMRFQKDENNDITGFREYDRAVYTYNSGSPITAAVELYKATGDESYLDYGRQWARNADAYFANATDTPDVHAYPPQNTWFHLILLNGYTALLPYEPAVEDYIARFRSGFDYSYENHRTAGHNGVYGNLLPRNMMEGFPGGDYNHVALDASAAAEIYALLALTFG